MNERLQIAETVRQACIKVAIESHEDARLSGLCHEGQWEYAVLEPSMSVSERYMCIDDA
jgi:hypothetical protein